MPDVLVPDAQPAASAERWLLMVLSAVREGFVVLQKPWMPEALATALCDAAEGRERSVHDSVYS